VLSVAVAGMLAGVVVLLGLLVEGRWQPLERLDTGVAGDLHQVVAARHGLVWTLDVLAAVLSPNSFRLAVGVLAVVLWRRGWRRLAVWMAVTAAAGGLLGLLVKVVVERARPTFADPVAVAPGYSFPSGHAVSSFLCCAILLVARREVAGARGRSAALAAAAFLVLLTGFDRVALGVHYVSDVLAGWFLAASTVAASLLALRTGRLTSRWHTRGGARQA
jgi:undecaprenyl-diphosphatase